MTTSLRNAALLAFATALSMISAATLVGAQVQPMNLKPGLWVVSITRQPPTGPGESGTSAGSGGGNTTSLSDADKAAVAAMAQRLQQLQQLQSSTHKDEVCVAKKQGAKPVFQPPDPKDSKCKRAVVKGTADAQDSTFECSGQAGGVGSMHADRDTDETAHGSGVMSNPDAHITVNFTFTAKWLRADCGKMK